MEPSISKDADSLQQDEGYVQITAENMHRIAAMLRFQIESELGRALPTDNIYATIQDGVPMVVMNVPDSKK